MANTNNQRTEKGRWRSDGLNGDEMGHEVGEQI